MKAGEVVGKAEVAVWIARRANVVLGDEWDNALQICADYFESAGETEEEIIDALNEIADAIAPASAGITHIVRAEPAADAQPTEAASVDPEQPDESDDSNEEPTAAEPPGEIEKERTCPNGNCPTVRSTGYGWWYW